MRISLAMCLHVLCYVHYIIIVDISTSISVKGPKHSSELNVSDDECTSAAKRPKQSNPQVSDKYSTNTIILILLYNYNMSIIVRDLSVVRYSQW